MVNIIKHNLFKMVLVSFFIVMPVISLAQENFPSPGEDFPPPCGVSGKICNPIDPIDSVDGFIQTLLEGVLRIGIPIVALAIIYSGFLFVAARGNSEKLTKAKDALLYSLIGAAILLGSWAIAQLISETITGLALSTNLLL